MPQYEMGLRDYWRILRKRKLVVILTCVATGGLTLLLTQHVFRGPPRFSVSCELSVRAAEVVGQPAIIRVNVAREAKVVQSEKLLRKVLWAMEGHPFYVPGEDAAAPKNEDEELEQRLLEALQPPTRTARTRELAYAFPNQTSSSVVEGILRAAREQERAISEAAGKPAEQATLLSAFPASGFLHSDENLRDKIVSQLQERLRAEWDSLSSTFEVTLETTAPGFGDEDAYLGSEGAVHLAESVVAVYQAYTEWEGRRAVRREIERIGGEIETLDGERIRKQDDRRQKQEKMESATANEEYREARRARLAVFDQFKLLERYAEQLDKYLTRRQQIASGTGKKKYPLIPSPAGVNDANIQELYRSSTQIEKEKTNRLEFYKPDSHVIVALDKKIARTASQLRDVVKGSIENERLRFTAAEQRFKEAQAKLQQPMKLQREVNDLTQRISYLVGSIAAHNQRLSQLSLFREQGVKVDLIGRPGTPEQLGRASALAKTIIGALIGLVFGVVIAVLWETFDLTIGTIEEVETFLETRVLGVVPHVEADRLAAEIRSRDPEAEMETSDTELQQRAMLVTLYEPKSVSAEAFRHIRTTLDFACMQQKPGAKVFLITSATLYEGKTIVAANLAVVMAQNGKRTCLVECDLRRPQLHRIFGVDRHPGLHDVFIGKMSCQEASKSLSDLLLGKIGMEAAVGTPGLENLTLLTCGSVPPNPVELLGSNEMRRLFAELREAYDVVIVDSPPILPVADAAVISPLTDGVVLVYRAGSAPRTVLSRAKTQLESVDTHLLGVVLNDLRPAAGEISATYPYKGYARKAYAMPEEQAAPRVPVTFAAEAAVDRASENAEDQAIRKVGLFLSQGKTEQAVEVAYQAAHALPQSISVRLELARAYEAGGRVHDAQAELIHVLDMDPRNPQALERLARIASDAGLDREALRWFEEILEFDPQNAGARARADEIRASLGHAGPQTV